MLAGKPDLILITRAPGNPPSPWAREWARYPQTKGKVAWIDPNLISRPGLRMAESIRSFLLVAARTSTPYSA